MITWREIKELVNKLTEEQLDATVIMWQEEGAITDIDAFQLEEDHYIDLDDSENGCFPESECEHLEPDTKFKKVYDKGHPVLMEVF